MKRFLRWMSAVAVAVVAVTVLLPAGPALAKMEVHCGTDCLLHMSDALCWEKELCPVAIVVKGKLPANGLTVYYRTRDGRASAPGDFLAVTEGALVLPPDVAKGELNLAIRADGETEPAEDFVVQVYATSLGKTWGESTVTIQDERRPG